MYFRRCLYTLAALAFVVTLALGPATARAQSPSLVTDREDYIPGETVVLMGSGFEAGETVDVSIAIDDVANNIHIGDYDWTLELADDTGDFITFWTVPLEAYGMTLRATALGLTSSRVATATFHDSLTGDHLVYFRMDGATFPADGYFLTVNGVLRGILSSSGAATFGPVLVPAGSPVDYFAAAVGSTKTRTVPTVTPGGTYPPGTWTLTSITPAAIFTAGPADGSTTVVYQWCYTPATPITNSAPAFAVTPLVDLGSFCPANGIYQVTFTPYDFVQGVPTDPDGDPVTLRFADGDPNFRTLTFDSNTSSLTFGIVATDNPAGPGGHGFSNLCTPLPQLSSQLNVTVTAMIGQQVANTAPYFTSSSNYNLGSMCSGSITVPITVANFNAAAHDNENDPFTFELSRTQVTLSLAPGVADGIVSCPVVITVTDNPAGRNCGNCTASPLSSSVTVSVSAHLHRNTAPVISAQNKDLGDVVGVLSGSTFSKTVAVTPAMFNVSVMDPENDPVAVSANVSNVTLVGPGFATATVTLTAQDDPYLRNNTCSPASSSVQVQVTARIIYNFEGPLAPLNWCIATKVQRGSTVPVRFRLYDANGQQVRTVPVNPAGGPTAHRISVAFNQANAPDGAVDVDEVGPCDEDEEFHYIPLLAWSYLLKTNSTYHLHTTYVIRIYTNDGVMHPVMISIK